MRSRFLMFLRGGVKSRADTWFLGSLLVLVLVVSGLNLLAPESSALHVSRYGLTLIGKYLCYAMLALSVDLIWGYCGILSLGQAAFFSLGDMPSACI